MTETELFEEARLIASLNKKGLAELHHKRFPSERPSVRGPLCQKTEDMLVDLIVDLADRHAKPPTPPPTVKMWTGEPPNNCNICATQFTKVFIDGRIKVTGQWAYMCTTCHTKFGKGLGTGLGQKYRKDRKGQWIKIKG